MCRNAPTLVCLLLRYTRSATGAASRSYRAGGSAESVPKSQVRRAAAACSMPERAGSPFGRLLQIRVRCATRRSKGSTCGARCVRVGGSWRPDWDGRQAGRPLTKPRPCACRVAATVATRNTSCRGTRHTPNVPRAAGISASTDSPLPVAAGHLVVCFTHRPRVCGRLNFSPDCILPVATNHRRRRCYSAWFCSRLTRRLRNTLCSKCAVAHHTAPKTANAYAMLTPRKVPCRRRRLAVRVAARQRGKHGWLTSKAVPSLRWLAGAHLSGGVSNRDESHGWGLPVGLCPRRVPATSASRKKVA